MSFEMNNGWFIRALAEGEPVLDSDSANAMSVKLGVTAGEHPLYCAVVAYNDLSDLVSDPMMPVRLYEACNHVGKSIPGFLYAYLSAKIRVVMVFREITSRDAAANKLFNGLSRRFALSVRVGIGKSYQDIKKLSFSRVDAYEVLDSNRDGVGISFVDDIYVSRSVTTRKLEGEKRLVIDLFRNGHIDKMMERVSDISEQIRAESPVRDGMPYPTSIRRTIVELLVQILHIGSDAGVDVEAILNHQDPYTRVFELFGTPKILEWFQDVVQRVYDGIADVNNRSENNMLTQAKRFIDFHIQNPDLSLQMVSEKLGITPGYFSAFFIRETGMGFNEYITGIRIELAKRLLSDPSKKINIVAQECGFQSSSYFIFVFRKKTGMSPGEYRKQNMIIV